MWVLRIFLNSRKKSAEKSLPRWKVVLEVQYKKKQYFHTQTCITYNVKCVLSENKNKRKIRQDRQIFGQIQFDVTRLGEFSAGKFALCFPAKASETPTYSLREDSQLLFPWKYHYFNKDNITFNESFDRHHCDSTIKNWHFHKLVHKTTGNEKGLEPLNHSSVSSSRRTR